MTCHDFEREMAEFLDQDGPEFREHIQQCKNCASIASDLRSIRERARTLQVIDEPSPRVWNSIEIALRQEGLIRPQPVAVLRPSSFSFIRGWGRAAWLVPTAAAVLVGAFLLGNPKHAGETAADNSPRAPRVLQVSNAPKIMDDDDQMALSAVRQRLPMMTAAYESNLNNVNEYIRDAQQAVNDNPNDEDAQRSLMDAYEQKSMLYNIALDRSLP